ncbi:MAG: hypothetical protein SWH68_00120, partial [Thermodesulfobacteriota bacterium]|nr:hypothetical protein [Thermodesulfobacteriota bacterium]
MIKFGRRWIFVAANPHRLKPATFFLLILTYYNCCARKFQEDFWRYNSPVSIRQYHYMLNNPFFIHTFLCSPKEKYAKERAPRSLAFGFPRRDGFFG